MIEQSEGYQSLQGAIMRDTRSGRSEAERLRVVEFAVQRAKHYEEKTGIPAGEVLTAWESRRDYWYMNYYQESKQPLLDGKDCRVFDTTQELVEAIGTAGYRCPHCQGVSNSPYQCDSGKMLVLLNSGGKKERCNWKSWGLFGTMGRGSFVFVKSEMCGEHIFTPIAWEKSEQLEPAGAKG